MKVAIAVLPNGMINSHFGRANTLTIAQIEDGEIKSWKEVNSSFAEAHGEHQHEHGNHDHHAHHQHPANHQAVIKNFLIENEVDLILLDHAGPGMQKVQEQTNIKIVVGAKGDAKEAVKALIEQGLAE